MIDHPLPRVIAVRHVHGTTLWLRFDDGAEGDVDLGADLRGELFAPLRSPALFARVRVEHGTLVWPNGADWSPEVLRERIGETKRVNTRSIDDGESQQPTYPSAVPEISRFYGLVIRMFANDHAPPHFHAYYGDHEVTVTIRDGLVTGQFPGRALRLVLEWQDLHADELMSNWDRLRVGSLPEPIPPLP
jgi:hypothetical protein